MQILNNGTESVPIDSITPHPENPNQGDRAAIAHSIETNGFYGFVICQRSHPSSSANTAATLSFGL